MWGNIRWALKSVEEQVDAYKAFWEKRIPCELKDCYRVGQETVLDVSKAFWPEEKEADTCVDPNWQFLYEISGQLWTAYSGSEGEPQAVSILCRGSRIRIQEIFEVPHEDMSRTWFWQPTHLPFIGDYIQQNLQAEVGARECGRCLALVHPIRQVFAKVCVLEPAVPTSDEDFKSCEDYCDYPEDLLEFCSSSSGVGGGSGAGGEGFEFVYAEKEKRDDTSCGDLCETIEFEPEPEPRSWTYGVASSETLTDGFLETAGAVGYIYLQRVCECLEWTLAPAPQPEHTDHNASREHEKSHAMPKERTAIICPLREQEEKDLVLTGEGADTI